MVIRVHEKLGEALVSGSGVVDKRKDNSQRRKTGNEDVREKTAEETARTKRLISGERNSTLPLLRKMEKGKEV